MTIRGIEHIGITVSDLTQAEQFFIEALDASVLYRIVPPDNPNQKVEGEEMQPLNGFPSEMKVTGLAMLRVGNGCNVELFQTQPTTCDVQAHPGQPGINHFSLYVEDIHQAAEKMRASGARMFEGPSDCFAQEKGKGNQTWFGMTPFGVLIELITLPSAIHYDKDVTQLRWIPES
ncbi:VOC family protein [Pantoea sp. LMR881]|uniref:VOC family protein n=1 Tax=Pantoea sp. LMR881 TaxID=3014336 RepID=UPI0022B0223A|nr:VOC family protein [Pantoea sp. LMR881]MCZ4061082.1 VOC family protein [Pantoea sp. LMR881]